MRDPQPAPREWLRLGSRHLRRVDHPVLRNFFADRGTHLAAMIAYYALLSLIPFLFLVLTLIGLIGEPRETSYLVQQLTRTLPGEPVQDVVDLVAALRRNVASFGLIGLVSLIWTSLGFLSAAGSALNIIYEVPDRAFVRQKLFILVIVSSTVVTVFAALVVATTVFAWVADIDGGVLGGVVTIRTVVSLLLTTLATFAFLWVVYRYLPNADVRPREALPGAIWATLVLQLSFQLLPLYVAFAEGLPTLRAFGGIVILLVWLFVMANVFVLGGELNFWLGRGRALAARGQAGDGHPGLA